MPQFLSEIWKNSQGLRKWQHLESYSLDISQHADHIFDRYFHLQQSDPEIDEPEDEQRSKLISRALCIDDWVEI